MKLFQTSRDEDKLILHTDEGTVYLMPVQENIIRCVYTKRDELSDRSLMVVRKKPCLSEPAALEESADEVRWSTERLSVSVQKENGKFRWLNQANGSVLLQEGGKELAPVDLIKYVRDEDSVVNKVKTVDGERQFVGNLKPVVDRTAFRARLYFDWKSGEAIYGLGQGEEGIFNYRGHNQYLYQHNMRTPVPFFISSEGYGIFFDCCSLMTFNDDRNGSYLFLDAVDQLDYYVIAGKNFDEIISGFRSLTGKAAMLPKWAFGYIQSKEAYKTQEELVDTVREYRKRNVPLDCVVQDWNYWEANKWGQKTPDRRRYPDLKEAVGRIHGMNAHAMISVWPNMGAESEDWKEFSQRGFLLGDDSTYDAFNPEARKLYWKQLERELYRDGFDAWWCDSTEPFTGSDWNGEMKREPWERYLLVGGEHKKFLDPETANAYALVHTKGIYENQRSVSDKKRVMILTRAGYPSQQKYGSVLWSGDTSATWETLRKQIAEGLSFCMSGMPYWTLDIGAFFTVGSEWKNRGCGSNRNANPLWFWKGDYNKGVGDLGYRELYVRWLEYGAFLPVFRSHGTDTPREIWNFGEKGEMFYNAIGKFIRLRYLLMPYIYSLAGATTQKDYTMMRSLMFDFADDPNVKNISDEFMFGSALLVCPVTNSMYYGKESRPLDVPKVHECYLPSGAGWTDCWSGEQYSGGRTVTVSAPLDRIPLFARSGSVIPMTRGLQYADQSAEGPMILKIYPGADSSFLLYEDSGDGYGYEKGEYSTVRLDWAEKERELTIGERNGRYENFEEKREFRIVLGEESRTVEYHGNELKIKVN